MPCFFYYMNAISLFFNELTIEICFFKRYNIFVGNLIYIDSL